MYAITLDLDQKTLADTYGSPSYTNAYNDIGRFLREKGFERVQGSVYFGAQDADVSAVTCVIAVQQLSAAYDWFAPSVRDIRMLRIEDDNDLMPALHR